MSSNNNPLVLSGKSLNDSIKNVITDENTLMQVTGNQIQFLELLDTRNIDIKKIISYLEICEFQKNVLKNIIKNINISLDEVNLW